MNERTGKEDTETAGNKLPKSVLDIKDDKKVDILVELGLQVRRNIHQWETRAFAASTWSIGIMLGVLVIWATRSTQGIQVPTQPAKIALVVVVVLFGILTQYLLAFCRHKFMENEPAGMAVQNGLRMFEPGQYFNGQPFSDPQASWGPAWHIVAMELTHLLITIATALGIYLT